MRQLAIIKLLDAFCVFSWACTSLLFAVFTFSLYTALDNRLEPTVVFTTVCSLPIALTPATSSCPVI